MDVNGMESEHGTGAEGDLVDWGLAKATARRFLPAPPRTERGEIERIVAQLRTLAVESKDHVREYTGMVPQGPEPPVLVVDRPGWVDVNVDGFAYLLGPLLEKMRAARPRASASMVKGVGSRVTGAELGALLAFLGGKVLGQYEPFTASLGPGAKGNGTLMLIAPNIVAVERELGVDPRDFRLWVCLHEETHRTQFTAVPWLAEYIRGQMTEFLLGTDVDPAALVRQLGRFAKGVLEAVTGSGEVSLLDLVQTPEQKIVLKRMTAVMSLLEGHADYVMDGVGPGAVPTVATIRKAFQERRASARGLDAMLRRLLGMEAKMRQYRDGERFVRGVVDRVGMSGFNEVWSNPETLPSLVELHDPEAWVARVHGPAGNGPTGNGPAGNGPAGNGHRVLGRAGD